MTPLVKSQKVIIAFTAAVILQGLHMIEHIVQLYQHTILRLPVFESHGILFFADLEWNHFIFNFLYLLLLAYIFVAGHFFEKFDGVSQIPRYIFLAGFYIQGYHVLEHTARIGQFLQTGCTPCKGVLGWFFDGVYLHFTLNAVTWILPLIAFFAYGFWEDLLRLIKKRA